MVLREIRLEGEGWMHMAQDKEQWRALVNTEMKLRFYKRRVISWSVEQLLAAS